ncbi:MAG: hypothetical protein U0798_10050 [Gemmataceae bacterium]
MGFVTLFGLLLASFPARNTDIWQHLANGRDLLQHGHAKLSSIYDLACYAIFQASGGSGLVGVKAVLIALTSLIIVITSHRKAAGWRIAVACSILAILAMSSRVLLQPHSVGYFFFSMLICPALGSSFSQQTTVRQRVAIPIIFLAWALFDPAFLIGLLVLLASWIGQRIDNGRLPSGTAPTGKTVNLATGLFAFVLLLVSLFLANRYLLPYLHVEKVELLTPFSRNYLSLFSDQPSSLAYFPLLLLTGFAFCLTFASLRWQHLLPWILLAVISAYQARMIPYFAIASGPLLAWMLQDWFAKLHAGDAAKPSRWGVSLIVSLTSVLFALAFLAFAWTGMLQGPPYGPRQWTLDLPPGIETTAKTLRSWYADKRIPTDAKTLHISQDTFAGFSWFCPEDRSVSNQDIQQVTDSVDFVDNLRKLGIKRVVASISDPRLDGFLFEYFINQAKEWPIRTTSGGVVIFSVNDPYAKSTDSDDMAFDINRIAFRPRESERIPMVESQNSLKRTWKDYFFKATPHRSAERDDASVYLVLAEASRQKSIERLQHEWSLIQSFAYLGQSFANPVMPNIFYQIIQKNSVPFNQFRFISGDVPTSYLYATIRAGRRAALDNPQDSQAYLNLGRAYRLLFEESTERHWATLVPSFSKLRLIQSSTAFQQAVNLNPNSPQARLEFARQLQKMDCQDTAIEQLEAYRNLLARSGESKSQGRLADVEKELTILHGKLDEQVRDYEKEAVHISVMDRAYVAAKRGLTSRALKMLKESDFSAFGLPGMKLELDLMLRLGQAEEVQSWLKETPDLRNSLGQQSYYWYLTQANAGVGDYVAALDHMTAVCNSNETLPPVKTIANDIAQAFGLSMLSESVDMSLMSQAVFVSLSRDSFSQRMKMTMDNLTLLADTLTLRTVILLEMGEVEDAEKSFDHLLHQYDPGKLPFNARRVAEQCEDWLRSARKKPGEPKRR